MIKVADSKYSHRRVLHRSPLHPIAIVRQTSTITILRSNCTVAGNSRSTAAALHLPLHLRRTLASTKQHVNSSITVPTLSHVIREKFSNILYLLFSYYCPRLYGTGILLLLLLLLVAQSLAHQFTADASCSRDSVSTTQTGTATSVVPHHTFASFPLC